MSECKPGGLLGTPLARIVARLTVTEDGCWVTNYHHDRAGYVAVRHDGRMQKLHRVAYETLVGPIPDGLQIDHLCRVRDCCNPAHLEPVTNRVNALRGVGPTALNAVKDECIHGHEFSPENTHIRTDGARRCIACRRRHRMAHYYRNRAAS